MYGHILQILTISLKFFYILFCVVLLENGKKRGPNKNQEARKREAKERKRRSQSKPKSAPQQVIMLQSSYSLNKFILILF